MTTITKTADRVDSGVGAIAVTLLLGAVLIWTTGFANSAALHGVAHDSRHSIAFPCD